MPLHKLGTPENGKCKYDVYYTFPCFCLHVQRPNPKKNKMCMGPYDGVDYSLTNSPYVHSRVDSNTFTMDNPMPESTLTLCQVPFYPTVRDFGFGLRSADFISRP